MAGGGGAATAAGYSEAFPVNDGGPGLVVLPLGDVLVLGEDDLRQYGAAHPCRVPRQVLRHVLRRLHIVRSIDQSTAPDLGDESQKITRNHQISKVNCAAKEIPNLSTENYLHKARADRRRAEDGFSLEAFFKACRKMVGGRSNWSDPSPHLTKNGKICGRTAEVNPR